MLVETHVNQSCVTLVCMLLATKNKAFFKKLVKVRFGHGEFACMFSPQLPFTVYLECIYLFSNTKKDATHDFKIEIRTMGFVIHYASSF